MGATRSSTTNPLYVIPAKAGVVVQGCTVYEPEDGIQGSALRSTGIPACAGMTVREKASLLGSEATHR